MNELGVCEERNTFFCRWNVLRVISCGQSSKEKGNFQGWSRKNRGVFRGILFLWQKQPKKSRFFNLLSWLDFFWNNSLLLSWVHHYARYVARPPTDQSTTYLKLKAALLSWVHHYARYVARAPTDQSTTYLKLKAASYMNRKKLGRDFFRNGYIMRNYYL